MRSSIPITLIDNKKSNMFEIHRSQKNIDIHNWPCMGPITRARPLGAVIMRTGRASVRVLYNYNKSLINLKRIRRAKRAQHALLHSVRWVYRTGSRCANGAAGKYGAASEADCGRARQTCRRRRLPRDEAHNPIRPGTGSHVTNT